MTRFRPCIDIHAGQVKQIVGGTLRDADTSPSSTSPSSSTSTPTLRTNHVSPHPAAHFARLYRARSDALRGAHVVLLGPGCEEAARAALAAWPGMLQLGGGVTAANAPAWVAAGAAKVIVTSYLFPDARFSMPRLEAVLAALDHDRSRLVVDLSCRKQGPDTWVVATDRWQRLTDMEVNADTIRLLEPYCSELLVHAADVEGLQRGIDEDLVRRLGEWCSVPVTYAGGATRAADLDLVAALSAGRVDLTIGSALDVFGGSSVTLDECVAWNVRYAGAGGSA